MPRQWVSPPTVVTCSRSRLCARLLEGTVVQSFVSGEALVVLEEYQEREARLPGDPALTELLKPFTLENSCRSPLGAATLGLWFLFVSVLMRKLCRKEIVVVLTIVITVPFFCYCM